jgi:hypothetical protein
VEPHPLPNPVSDQESAVEHGDLRLVTRVEDTVDIDENVFISTVVDGGVGGCHQRKLLAASDRDGVRVEAVSVIGHPDPVAELVAAPTDDLGDDSCPSEVHCRGSPSRRRYDRSVAGHQVGATTDHRSGREPDQAAQTNRIGIPPTLQPAHRGALYTCKPDHDLLAAITSRCIRTSRFPPG